MAGHLFHIERNNEPKNSFINISDTMKLNSKNASFAACESDDIFYKWNVT